MKNHIEMGYQMAVKFPTCYPMQIEKLVRIAHSLETLDVRSCNYGLSEKEENRVTNLEEKANAICKEFGAVAYHQSDPRGCSLYVVNPNELGDNPLTSFNQRLQQHYTKGVAIY